jgi:hypothetical protein
VNLAPEFRLLHHNFDPASSLGRNRSVGGLLGLDQRDRCFRDARRNERGGDGLGAVLGQFGIGSGIARRVVVALHR